MSKFLSPKKSFSVSFGIWNLKNWDFPRLEFENLEFL